MSEPRLPEEGSIPEALARKPSPRSMQLVWIVPIVAALVGAGIAFRSFIEHGSTIRIEFRSAEGLEAHKTKIKYKDVDVGTVRSVKLSPDHKHVVVTAEMSRDAEDFLVDDTRFWVVRPRIAGGQVSGLSTLIAGSYIGADPGHSNKDRSDFVGLETPPVVTSDDPGRPFTLLAPNLGSLDVNAPVYYRGVLAGRVVSTEVAGDGGQVVIGVYIQQPYDKFVNSQTRWWNASGIDFTVDASGVKVETQSLVTLLLGGVAFETPSDQATPQAVADSARFTLWDSRADAFLPRETEIDNYTMMFTQTVRGLTVGAPIDFRGITVGEVKRIDLDFDQQSVTFRSAVTVQIWPRRLQARNLRAGSHWAALSGKERMKAFVEHGLRGQLRNSNLLTGGLYIALDFFKDQPHATLDIAQPQPEIPTAAGGLGELQESLANIVKKLEKVPFDVIGENLKKALADLSVTLKRVDQLAQHIDTDLTPQMKAAIEQARKTLQSAEQVLGSDSPVQGDLRDTLNRVERAADSLRALTDYLERHPESLIRGRPGEKK